MRNPKEIAQEAREHLDNANKAFVPANLVKLADLNVEFMESVASTLDAAGLIPAEQVPAPEQPSA